VAGLHKVHPSIYPMQVTHKKYGKSGIEVSDWWPHVGSCIDDIAVVRSMWTTDNDHGAQLQFHTGRHALEGPYPTIGSWVSYGLGTMSQDLPSYLVLAPEIPYAGSAAWDSSFLPAFHQGVRVIPGKEAIPNMTRQGYVSRQRLKSDRRAYALKLTPKGNAARIKLMAAAAAHERELDRLVGAKRAEIIRILKSVAAALSQAGPAK